MGVSPGAVYSALRRFQGRRRRLRRADAGQPRKVSLDAVRAVAAIKAAAADTLNGRALTTAAAIAIAETNGHIAPGALSRSAFERHARSAGFSGPVRVYQRFQAQRSNQLHHVDSSQSKYFRVLGRRPDGDWLLAVRTPAYARKRDVEPYGLWATAVVDDHSRCKWIEYDVAAGESAAMVAKVLAHAWSGDPRCALRGLPESLLCDHGPLRRSDEGQQFADVLGVTYEDRNPNSPWVGGKVERPWRHFIQSFELPWLLKPDAQITLSDLNRMAAAWTGETNAMDHPFFLKQSRLDVYAAGLDLATVRLCPEDAHREVYHEHYRLVRTDGTIRYKNDWYLVPDELVGLMVRVLTKGDTGEMLVEHDGRTFPVKIFAPHDAGQYRAHPDTPALRLVKDGAPVVNRLPIEDAPASAHLHNAPQAEIRTPFTAAADESFINREEALAQFCRWLGKPLHTLPDDIRESVMAILSRHEMLNKSVLFDFATELRARMAAG